MAAVLPTPAGGSAAAPPPVRHSALGEEVLAIYAYTTATLAGLVAGFGMLLVLFWASAPMAVLLPWMVLFIGLWFARVGLAQAFRRAVRKHGESTDFGRWHLYWNILTLCSGATKVTASGKAAPETKLAAEARAACTGLAVRVSLMPSSSRA